MKAILITLIGIAGLSLCVSCSREKPQVQGLGEKLQVTVTFNALAEMTRAVGKDHITLTTIIPAGVEPHDFEPKAQDLAALANAKVFVYNGFNLESWVPKALEAAGSKSLTVVDASKGAVPLLLPPDDPEAKEHGGIDPHLWLSISGAETETKNIAEALSTADPTHADEYAANAQVFITSLEDLKATYGPRMAGTARKAIVTGHAAFGYLCRDFGLEQNSVEDVFATGEPTARQLADLVNFVRQKKVKTIFAEELASPAVSRTLADEVGAKVVTIYTLESAEDGKSMIERVRSNLESIATSLTE